MNPIRKLASAIDKMKNFKNEKLRITNLDLGIKNIRNS